MLKIIVELLSLGYVHLLWSLCLDKKPPAPTKRATVILITVKSYNALLYIGIYLSTRCVARGRRRKQYAVKLKNLHCYTCYRF